VLLENPEQYQTLSYNTGHLPQPEHDNSSGLREHSASCNLPNECVMMKHCHIDELLGLFRS
jgi:hypothetical protein